MNRRVVARIINRDDPREVFAELVATPLSDGSKVYDVELQKCELGAQNETRAMRIMQSLCETIYANTNNEVEIQ